MYVVVQKSKKNLINNNDKQKCKKYNFIFKNVDFQ